MVGLHRTGRFANLKVCNIETVVCDHDYMDMHKFASGGTVVDAGAGHVSERYCTRHSLAVLFRTGGD